MASLTVSHLIRTSKNCFSSFVKLGNALVPAGDDLLGSKLELEWLVALFAGVEHASISKLSSVVNFDLLSCLWLGTSACLLNLNLEGISLQLLFLFQLLLLLLDLQLIQLFL